MAEPETTRGQLDRVQGMFLRWREQYGGRGHPIPAELWKAAAQVAAIDGVNATARALGVDSARLARRVERSGASPVAQPEQTAMIQLTPQMRLLVAVAPVDFRRGIDGLCRLCREVLSSDPFSGTGFIFRNQRGTGIKLLTYVLKAALQSQCEQLLDRHCARKRARSLRVISADLGRLKDAHLPAPAERRTLKLPRLGRYCMPSNIDSCETLRPSTKRGLPSGSRLIRTARARGSSSATGCSGATRRAQATA